MPKGKNKQKNKQPELEEEDNISNSSQSSQSVRGDNNVPLNGHNFENEEPVDLNANNINNALDSYLDALTESRSQTREKNLDLLNKALSNSVLSNFIDSRRATLGAAIKNSIKKGGNTEQLLAVKTFALFCITLGVDCEPEFNEFYSLLTNIITNKSEPGLISSAIEALSISTFIGCQDEVISQEQLRLFENIFRHKKHHPIVKVAALNGWALLTSVISLSNIKSSLYYQQMPIFIDLLKDEDVDVRVSAGQVIAMLFQMQTSENNIFTTENIDMNSLYELLQALSNDSNRHKSKKDKQKQKASFREIRSTIENGTDLEEVITINGSRIQFTTWASLFQLNTFRSCLNIGFHVHFQENPLFEQIFTGSKLISRAEVTSPHDVKKYFSPNSVTSKERTLLRDKQRIKKDVILQSNDNF